MADEFDGGVQEIQPFMPETLDDSFSKTRWLDPKLYVGGLPPNMGVDELKGFFEYFGPVSECIVMTDRDSGLILSHFRSI